jgi:lauroyl/myristoyl acyltransferase
VPTVNRWPRAANGPVEPADTQIDSGLLVPGEREGHQAQSCPSMSKVQTASADLKQTLAAIERPSSRKLRVTGVSLRDRARVSPVLGRLTPVSVAVRRAERRGERRWEESARARKKASRWMAEMLGVPADGAEAQGLAREAVVDSEVRRALTARHWEAGHGPIYGLDSLREARERGRGVLLAGLHIGVLFNAPMQIATQYCPYYLVRATRGQDRQGAGALVIKQRMVAMERAGNRWLERKNSYPVVRALLERGEMCGLMFDSGGRVETEVAGQRTYLAGGIAGLAWETGAPIVLGVTLREGEVGTACYLHEPIESADFDGPEEMHHHLAVVCSRVIRDNLVQLYPRRLPSQPRGG